MTHTSADRSFSSYPKPDHRTHPHSRVPPPPLLPYLAPPGPLPPPLPSRPKLTAAPGWSVSHHAVPAAYPRRFADSFGDLSRESKPQSVSLAGHSGGDSDRIEQESKEERIARNEGEARTMLRMRYDSAPGKVDGQERGLWMAAERWCRLHGREGSDDSETRCEGVTLVITHANGLHKEMWYPTLNRLLGHNLSTESAFGGKHREPAATNGPASEASERIDEIWLFDDIHHGASLDLNAGRIGPVHGWSDGGRDIVNFLLHVWMQDEAGHSSAYPAQCLRWRDDEQREGQRKRVIGVGHSFGGNALVQAAAERPDLFHALFLVDPMCPAWVVPRSSIHLPDIGKWWPLVLGAIKRRGSWPSLESAKALRRAPFFAAWHQEVWDIFLSHGLVSKTDGGGGVSVDGEGQGKAVQLATPPWAEAAVFGEPTGLHEGWDRLEEISAEVVVGFLMANEPKATFGRAMTSEMVWRAPNSVNEILPDAGHLAVQERPDRVADALSRFLGSLEWQRRCDRSRAKL